MYSYRENTNVIESGTHNLESGKVLQNVEALESESERESSWKSSESYPILESSFDFGYNRFIIISMQIVKILLIFCTTYSIHIKLSFYILGWMQIALLMSQVNIALCFILYK